MLVIGGSWGVTVGALGIFICIHWASLCIWYVYVLCRYLFGTGILVHTQEYVYAKRMCAKHVDVQGIVG